MKKLLLIIAVLCVFIFPGIASAAGGFNITSYDVNIQVNENNTYNVTENITADFYENHHGIERFIPQQVTASRYVNEEYESKKYHILVSGIEANTPFSSETSDGYYDIRLGDPDVTVTGAQQYTLAYLYDPGDDGYDTFDDFYFNIIGTQWDVPIDNVTFTITMPKEFDTSKIGFNLGSEGTSGYNPEDLQFSVEGNVITGSVNRTMYPYEALTIRLELPNGYYVGARENTGPVNSMVIASLVLLGIGLLLAAIFIRKKKPVQTVEFYPPEGMTSADVGYVIDGLVEDKDVISLLIYWADKGYLEIHQKENSKNMEFVKIKDLPETANDYEKRMFDDMFAGRDKTSITQLQYKFYDTIAAAKQMVGYKYQSEGNLVFTRRSVSLQNLVAFLASLPLAVMAYLNIYQQTFEVVIAVVVGAIVLAIGYAFIALYIKSLETWLSAKRSTKVGRLIGWAIGTSLFYFIIVVLSIEVFGAFAFLPAAVALILTFVAPNFRCWTDQGALWAGRILGLKNFIQTVELEKLKMMVDENPQYFYNVLPYAYVLGVTNKWSKRFESIAIEPPHWYYGYGYGSFNSVFFTSMLMSSMLHTQTAMLSRPNTNSGSFGGGGGFSGGGFSGGGFGGGGGGSW